MRGEGTRGPRRAVGWRVGDEDEVVSKAAVSTQHSKAAVSIQQSAFSSQAVCIFPKEQGHQQTAGSFGGKAPPSAEFRSFTRGNCALVQDDNWWSADYCRALLQKPAGSG